MLRKLVTLFIAIVAGVSGCDCSHDTGVSPSPRMRKDNMLELESCAVSDDELAIAYRIVNDKDYPIWICDGVDYVGRTAVELRRRTLCLKSYSRLLYPKSVLLYVPPITLYSEVSPGETTRRVIRVPMPINEESRHVHLEDDGHTTGRQERVVSVVLKIGYFTQESIDSLGILARTGADGKIEVAALEVEIPETIMEITIPEASVLVDWGN